MSSCCLFKDEFLGSCTKKLIVGGINICNISTKAWSNLNEESIQQFRNFCLTYSFFVPGIVFHLSLFYLIFGMSIH